MSLDWNITKIKDNDSLCWVENPEHPGVDEKMTMNPITNALIWACLSVGMTGITQKNWMEFYIRLHLIEHMSGTFLVSPKNNLERYWLTPKDVKDHIGLRTNCHTQTWAQFVKEQSGNFRHKLLRELEREEKEQNATDSNGERSEQGVEQVV